MLKAGDKAPAFALTTDSGETLRSSTLKGKRYVLFFYPKDDTPGCTREACSFRDGQAAFKKLGVPVYGVSADSAERHAKFVSKYDLNFPLLADPEHKLLEAYGVWVEKNLYGRRYFGIQRASFIVGSDGRIEHVWEKVKPDGHADEVLAALRGGAAAKPAAKASAKAAAKAPASKRAAGSKAAKAPAAKKAPAARKPAAKKTAAKPVARSGGRGR